MSKKLIMLLLISSAAFADDRLNPDVTQETIMKTACVPSWTGTVRPSASYINKLKKKQLPDTAKLSDYEEDHIIPLALGGHPRNPVNLHPQLWSGKCGAHEKDKDELRYHRLLCSGAITLEEAQSRFMPWECE